MIYLDSAATTLQKPRSVAYAVSRAISCMASPGRGAHSASMLAADLVLDCRAALGELFSVPAEKVVFTSSCTHGLNIALKSLVSAGDRVVVSGYEHNAVIRPLQAIGAEIDVAAGRLFAPEETLRAFERKLPGAAAAVCCHVSNVFGCIQPLEEIASLCRRYGVPLVVDAAQSAGSVALNVDRLGCAFAAMPGHKGLFGPQGTGVLLCGNTFTRPLMEGGTGVESERNTMPEQLPERLEAGTHNVPGIAGLLEGVRWVVRQRSEKILCHERMLADTFCDGLRGKDGIKVFRSSDVPGRSGVVSVRFERVDCEDVARMLGERGIAVRAGLHCAPLAHRTAGTLESGTVRFSFSPFNTLAETEHVLECIKHLAFPVY